MSIKEDEDGYEKALNGEMRGALKQLFSDQTVLWAPGSSPKNNTPLQTFSLVSFAPYELKTEEIAGN